MNFWRSMAGMLEGELTSADPGAALQAINQRGIRLYHVEADGELTVRFLFSRGDHRTIAGICRRRGDSLKILQSRGVFWTVKNLLRRPVLLAGILFLLGLTFFLPTRVLFVSVEGNVSVPARQILAAAEDCGIRFGASRREVRSEKMKNALLGALPELKWAGINTAGCTAVISVRERGEREETERSSGFGNIVAVRDGYITSCTVTRGSALCGVGQVVKEGQVLISGYNDCGICIQVTEAEGEVYAQTSRDFCVVTPSECVLRLAEKASKRNYSLIIGKKRINLWKDSGIWDATCGRMYEEYYITLPGGFRLPVCLAVETVTWWETVDFSRSPEMMETELLEFARRYAISQTVAGQILETETVMEESEGIYIMKGRFLCSEMIGRVNKEQIGETNGESS